MKNHDEKTGRRRIARIAVAGLLTLCMSLTAALEAPVYGASEFSGGTPFSSTGRSTYYHNGRFAGNLIVNGVDMSDWQSASCNMSTAKSVGADFAILRVTWTSYSKDKFSYKNNDSSFVSNYRNARAAGMMTGAYVFSQATSPSEARSEANYAVSRLRALGITPANMDLPVYMDYEFAGGSKGRLSGIKRDTATASAIAFCEVIRNAGFTPGIYANTSFFNSYINTSSLPSDVDLWCAQYYSRCQSGVRYTKWQYSSSARIGGLLSYLGVSGNIDVNFWYLNRNSGMSPAVTVSGTTTYKYTGSAVKPSLQVYAGDTRLREGVDYTLNGIRNVNPGTAYAYIRGIGKYSGAVIKPFTITGNPTKIKSLKRRRKGFWIKVAKKSKKTTSGYQVRYSRKSDMSGSKIKTIGKKYNKVSKRIYTKKRKTYYYVQVRSYKKVGGKKVYSEWSPAKRIKTK